MKKSMISVLKINSRYLQSPGLNEFEKKFSSFHLFSSIRLVKCLLANFF